MSEFNNDIFPGRPFDGQQFIDANRILWVYNIETNTWRRSGTVSTLPLASESQSGLLSAKLKQLIDGIPENGGHFGIIAQPLLSLTPQGQKVLRKDTIKSVQKIDSGTKIVGQSTSDRTLTPEQFAGKVLIFNNGILTKKGFLIFTNDQTSIFLDGDASAAAKNDEYVIVNQNSLNPNGILVGDIMLVSESLDITCVDGSGNPVKSGCNLDIIQCDGNGNPPGLNFQINTNFLESFCVTVPGCKGPKGDKGDQGDAGADGTGDGPVGEQGDPGQDVPAIGNTFSGIKILDIDDIYDTAVVSLELDAENGKLNLIKAKVRTPDSDTPATQVVSTPIDRSIEFTNPFTFDYNIQMPTVDPIGTTDIDILKYPHMFNSPNEETNIEKIKLSGFINSVLDYYQEKLDELNDKYNQQIKTYVESKDAEARTILADLAQQLAECEWELPLDFCLSPVPDDCHKTQDGDGLGREPFDYPYAEILFGSTGGTVVGDSHTAIDLGNYFIEPNSDLTYIKYPDATSESASITLPPGGYVIQWISGAGRTSETDWVVGSETIGEGLEATINNVDIDKMPVPSTPFNPKELSAVEFAYREAPLTEKTIAVRLIVDGTIALTLDLPGNRVQGGVKVKVLKVDLS